MLGLFDLLEERETGTPSKRDALENNGTSKVHATPSKRASTSDVELTPRMGRTPMSASKRQYLNHFMTPLKKRDANAGTKTPSSVSKLHFETPQFLKRHTLPTLDENGQFDAPAPLKLPRKPLGRGLSEIVASLRQVEDDQADEDLDALREAEAEEAGMPRPQSRATLNDQVLVKDSQSERLPLGGFDDEGMYDSPVEDGKDTNGNPLRVFKKKGQKRTTRRVNMRPTWTKRPTTTGNEVVDEDSDDEAIPKTQVDGTFRGDGEMGDVGSDSEFEEGQGKANKSKKTSKTNTTQKEGPVKRAARKVNELAHANFQKLKLRQNGAKGGPGYNSRFRRRR